MESTNCPSCGAGLNLFSPLTKLVVCAHCGSIVSIREDKLSIKGKQSGLAPTVSGLQIGQSGELEKKRFTVLGRVRYKYDEGHWDEWHLRFNDGSECWLSEDEGEFCLEQPAKPSKRFRSISEVELGETIQIGSWNGSVDEKNSAECVGFEGELPEEFDVGDKIAYAEGSGDSNQMFTLEEDEGGVICFLGKWVPLATVTSNTGSKF